MLLERVKASIKNLTGATGSELTVLSLLFAGLIIGVIYGNFQSKNPEALPTASLYFDTILAKQAAEEKALWDSAEKENQIAAKTEVLTSPSETKAGKESFSGVIHISTASKIQLMKLPGIGEKTAEKIIAYRDYYGFSRIEDIMKVRGIGQKKFDKMKPYLAL